MHGRRFAVTTVCLTLSLSVLLLSFGYRYPSKKPYVPPRDVGLSASVQLKYAEEGNYYAQQRIDQLTGANAKQQAKIDELQKRVDALTAASVATGYGGGGGTVYAVGSSVPNHFAPGWCTWYVASKRPIPWFGDAGTWLIGAQQYGFAIGSTPRVGAIMVSAESYFGHVAYVESVQAGSFTVSEMNYCPSTCLWHTDIRTVVPGTLPIKGFIY